MAGGIRQRYIPNRQREAEWKHIDALKKVTSKGTTDEVGLLIRKAFDNAFAGQERVGSYKVLSYRANVIAWLKWMLLYVAQHHSPSRSHDNNEEPPVRRLLLFFPSAIGGCSVSCADTAGTRHTESELSSALVCCSVAVLACNGHRAGSLVFAAAQCLNPRHLRGMETCECGGKHALSIRQAAFRLLEAYSSLTREYG